MLAHCRVNSHPMATRFSVLLSRLLEALAREKRYARNVAHELRNPLAEMRLMADVGSRAEDPAAWRAAIGSIGAAAAEMEQIVEALMALTRYEAGLETPEPEPIDLAGELLKLVQSLASAAEQQRTHDSARHRQRDLGVRRQYCCRPSTREPDWQRDGARARVARGDGVAADDGDRDTHQCRPASTRGRHAAAGRAFLPGRVSDGDHGRTPGSGCRWRLPSPGCWDLEFRLTLRDDGWPGRTLSGFRSRCAVGRISRPPRCHL